ncbi:MAG: DUF2785 domain-containing protein [Lysobacter sp.]
MRSVTALLALLLLAFANHALAACPPDGWTRASLQQLKDADFSGLSTDRSTPLAFALVDCLDHPDPDVRDGIAYGALAAWMRGGKLTPETSRTLLSALYRRLDARDPDGFGRPFAALVLAEVARTDRVAAWMTPGELADMVQRAAAYLEGVRDYRGFQRGAGWRHGVAHGADWLMQLSLNPALDDLQRQRLLAAVATQVVPGQHAYVFGEPERLAAPVLLLARGGLHDAAGWQAWLGALPARLDSPDQGWSDEGWLTRRHNLRAFLGALHVSATLSDNAEVKELLPGVTAALRAMP